MGPLFLQPLRLILGWMFVLAGAAFCLWGVLRMFPAVQGGKLDTGGPFALVRHPIYSGWIVFLFPGIALVTGAWLVSAASVLAWLAFRKWVPIEEQALLDRFGQPYREYMDRTPALFPFPK
jgi:protein-S-isoprenylcysteine O-methyltransferase Ste14